MKPFRVFDNRTKEIVKAYIDTLPDGKRYDVTIKLHRERRTIPQNSLYHLWMNCIAKETGNTTDDVKRATKEMFIGYREVQIFGKTSYKLPSTTEMDTKQMSEYMTAVQGWAAEDLGVILPTPDDLYFQQFYDDYK